MSGGSGVQDAFFAGGSFTGTDFDVEAPDHEDSRQGAAFLTSCGPDVSREGFAFEVASRDQEDSLTGGGAFVTVPLDRDRVSSAVCVDAEVLVRW